MMTEANSVRTVLDMLYRDRSTWRLRAEIDPSALSRLGTVVAKQLGLPRDVALRVIENELEVRPLPSKRICRHRAVTRRDLPRVGGPWNGYDSN
ncbi:MAG: hypothetical protein AAGF11_21180 [Myxococcota bacterium]